MKRLEKKNLKTLAQIMPVLSEKEQREYVGGVLYVDSGGAILGWDGGSYDMFVTDMLPTDYMINPAESGNFLGQSEQMKQSVITGIARQKGIGAEGSTLANVDISFFSMEGEYENYLAGSNAWGKDENGNYSGAIAINTNGPLYQSAENYYDYQLALTHEIDHVMTPEDKNNEMTSEYTAYKAMLNDAIAIENCSQGFYNDLYNKYLEYHEKMVEAELATDADLIERIR